MDNNINDIISSLTDDDINMLKGVASSILGGENQQSNDNTVNQNNNQSRKNQSNQPNGSNSNSALPANLGFDNIDFDMIMKAKRIFDKMNNTPDKNVDLILALRPHLRPETQNKADQAMKILKLFDILPLLRELF